MTHRTMISASKCRPLNRTSRFRYMNRKCIRSNQSRLQHFPTARNKNLTTLGFLHYRWFEWRCIFSEFSEIFCVGDLKEAGRPLRCSLKSTMKITSVINLQSEARYNTGTRGFVLLAVPGIQRESRSPICRKVEHQLVICPPASVRSLP